VCPDPYRKGATHRALAENAMGWGSGKREKAYVGGNGLPPGACEVCDVVLVAGAEVAKIQVGKVGAGQRRGGGCGGDLGREKTQTGRRGDVVGVRGGKGRTTVKAKITLPGGRGH